MAIYFRIIQNNFHAGGRGDGTVPTAWCSAPEALFLDVSTVCHDPQTGV